MKKLFNRFISPKKKTIIVVSGLPRSGTSMMMKMLEAGGLPPMTDNIRTADGDNPKGYYEFERVKKMKEGDLAWLADAEGKVVKVISALLQYLPDTYTYKIIFMRRDMPEILASQTRMLVNRGEDTNKINDDEMAALYEKHLAKTFEWLRSQQHMDVLFIHYNKMLADPTPEIPKINQFLGGTLDTSRMAQIIDPSLYRQRQEEN
jgi:hypothetical protein